MKLLKPGRLSVVTRSFEYDRQYQLGISVLAYFDLCSGALLEEVDLWKMAADELGKDTAIDAGIPKVRAEYLVHGSAFVPDGVPSATCPVTVELGDLTKTIYVVGDRFWKGSAQSDPIPFTSMPITWDRAYGGPGFPENPVGKGFAPVETEYGPVQFLPNLETPGRMLSSPSERGLPVGLGGLDLTWPQRFSKAGTYDRAWLEERFPGFAADMDWTIHNAAPPDQQQEGAFRGDESIRILNMHPSKPVLEGRLPSVRARAFVTQRSDGRDVMHEVSVLLRTVWLVPHRERGILVFQGAVRTREDDAADVVHLLLGAERLDEDKGEEHYRTVLARRLDKEDGVLYALRDQDLLPTLPDGYVSEADADLALVKMEGLLGKNLRCRAEAEILAAREKVRSFGLDPDEHAPLMPPPEQPLPDDPIEAREHLEKIEAQAEAQQAAQAEAMERMLEELTPLLEMAGVAPETLRAEIETPNVGPPTFTAAGEIARIRALAVDARALGLTVDELEEWSTDEEIHARWREAEHQIRNAYLASAHLQGVAPRRSVEESARIREEVLARHRSGEPFAYVDLTGADLSGLDLRGADFRRGWLESVSLRDADLRGADFSEAVLARADLTGALASATRFAGTNLGGAIMTRIVVDETTELSGAVMMKADLTDVCMTGARMVDVDLNEATFLRTVFRDVDARDVTFYKADLTGLSFTGSRLETIALIECDVSGLDLSDTTLREISFVQCRGRGIRLTRARGALLAAVLCESFAESDFRDAVLETVCFRGMDLAGSDFSGARLTLADLSEANLEQARLYHLVAREGRFVRTSFRRADLTGADLMKADLSKADIRGTTLRGANLFGANFGRVWSDEDTDLRDSNQKRVTIYPLRQP